MDWYKGYPVVSPQRQKRKKSIISNIAKETWEWCENVVCYFQGNQTGSQLCEITGR